VAPSRIYSISNVTPKPISIPQLDLALVNQQAEALLNRTEWQLFRLDGYLGITESVECRGWRRHQVRFTDLGEDYIPPIEIQEALNANPIPPPRGNTGCFGLRSCQNIDPFDECPGELHLTAIHGTFNDLWNQSWSINPLIPKCLPVRQKLETSWWPLETSPLWHQITTGTVLITKDREIVLAQRGLNTPYEAGRWDVTTGEQMIRWHPNKQKHQCDIDPFACSARGLKEEIGIDVDPECILLLSVGIEFSAFSTLLVFLAECEYTYDQIVASWKTAATTGAEIAAFDCIAATPEEIQKVFGNYIWEPTKRVRSVYGPDYPELRREWCIDSRARLWMFKKHLLGRRALSQKS
jgi:hypothetical protein